MRELPELGVRSIREKSGAKPYHDLFLYNSTNNQPTIKKKKAALERYSYGNRPWETDGDGGSGEWPENERRKTKQ